MSEPSEIDRLVAFLGARYDEIASGPWRHHVEESYYRTCPAARQPMEGSDLPVGEEFCDCGMPQRRDHVILDLAAKRRIMRACRAARDPAVKEFAEWDVLRNFATPFYGHPDYEEGWTPNH